jgi:hypothetical protein
VWGKQQQLYYDDDDDDDDNDDNNDDTCTTQIASLICHYVDCAMVEARVQSQSVPCGICDRQSGSETGFSLSTLVFSSQYHSTYAPYSLIHSCLTLYNVSS